MHYYAVRPNQVYRALLSLTLRSNIANVLESLTLQKAALFSVR